MDMPMVPAWLEAALAYATVAIAAMTAFARILDRVVPQLRAIDARSGVDGPGAAGFVARIGGGLAQALAFVQRYIPQVTVGSAPPTPVIVAPEHATPVVAGDDPDDGDDVDDEDDDPGDGGPSAAGAGLAPRVSERTSHPEPHGPYAGG